MNRRARWFLLQRGWFLDLASKGPDIAGSSDRHWGMLLLTSGVHVRVCDCVMPAITGGCSDKVSRRLRGGSSSILTDHEGFERSLCLLLVNDQSFDRWPRHAFQVSRRPICDRARGTHPGCMAFSVSAFPSNSLQQPKHLLHLLPPARES